MADIVGVVSIAFQGLTLVNELVRKISDVLSDAAVLTPGEARQRVAEALVWAQSSFEDVDALRERILAGERD